MIHVFGIPPGSSSIHSYAHNGGVPLLLVEDEVRVAGFIAEGLQEQSYQVDIATDGEQAMYLAAVKRYEAAIVDVLLPKKRRSLMFCYPRRMGALFAESCSEVVPQRQSSYRLHWIRLTTE